MPFKWHNISLSDKVIFHNRKYSSRLTIKFHMKPKTSRRKWSNEIFLVSAYMENLCFP